MPIPCRAAILGGRRLFRRPLPDVGEPGVARFRVPHHCHLRTRVSECQAKEGLAWQILDNPHTQSQTISQAKSITSKYPRTFSPTLHAILHFGGSPMLSERQLAANRENAQKSTGPRTPEGKSVCAQNASRHGKLADEVLLACEDRKQFIRYSRRYHREFQPIGHLEKSLVNEMVAASWRRDRLGILEARLIDHSYNTIPEPILPQSTPEAEAPHPDHSPVAFRNALGYRELVDTSKVLPQLSRDAARHNRDFHKALATLLRLRATQAKNPPVASPASDCEDPYYQGKYDRPVIPPPADPPGSFPEDLLGLLGSVPTPNAPGPEPPAPIESATSDLCVGWAILPAAGFQPAVPEHPAAPAPPTTTPSPAPTAIDWSHAQRLSESERKSANHPQIGSLPHRGRRIAPRHAFGRHRPDRSRRGTRRQPVRPAQSAHRTRPRSAAAPQLPLLRRQRPRALRQLGAHDR